MKISKFEDLDCWKEGRQLTRQIYEAIGQNLTWQKDHRLCGQIQGAAGSVMANIAEGFVRHSDKESRSSNRESFIGGLADESCLPGQLTR